MKTTDLINQIDVRTSSKEYENFKATKNRLIEIRGKLLHGIKLSKNDLLTLTAESFYLG